MKMRNLAAMLLTVSLSLAMSQSAVAGRDKVCEISDPPLADHAHACAVALGILDATIAGADFANDRDPDRLVCKVSSTDLKLHAGKPYDALQKLGDIRAKIDGLLAARKLKIDAGDAGDILAEVENVELCILTNIASF